MNLFFRCIRVAFATLLVSGLPSLSAAQSTDVSSLYSDLRWRMIGPFRGGRTVAGAGIPDQPCVFFIGVNNGGVWKTNDCGNTWQPVFEGQTQSIGALAIAPSNPDILYVGTGEGLRRPDLSTGDGVYKSSDGGKTWTHLGLRDGQQIGSIVVDPKNPDRLFVAVLGHPYGPNPERGIFRSLDGGQNFTKVLFKSDDIGGIDLAFDPRDSRKIYASLWASRRPPWTVGGNYEGAGSGLFKSEDGGDNWRELSKGFPAKHGRISIAISPSDPDRMYSTVDVDDAGGVYRSEDAGESWAVVNEEPRVSGRNSDFAFIRVHPKERDTIFLSNTSTYKSTDGGKNFTAVKGAPGGDDYHSTWINPLNPDIMLVTSDQGAVVTVNGGQTYSSWYNQPTAQIYHVAADNQFPYWVYGSQQESGSAGTTSRGDGGAITFRDWHPVGIEEYGYVAPDPLHPDILYGGKFTKFDRRTGQVQDVSPWVVRTGKYRLNRSQPVMFSPVDPHILYFASDVLFKTVNGGHSWQEISPDLTRPDPDAPTTLQGFLEDDPAKGKHRGVIYSLAPSPKDVNLIWAGTDDGLVHVTRDGGHTWKNVSPPELTPWSKISQIDAGHFDVQTAYISVNRFRLDDLHAYIYRTHDGGKSWKKITQGISDDASVNAVREDPKRPGLLFASTERAMWVSFDDGDHWHSLQLNLPFTSMRDFVVHGDDLVLGTHGRSFWILDDITALREIHEADALQTKLFHPQQATRIQRSTNPDTPLPPETPMGQNPPDGAIFDYCLKGDAHLVTLEILDAAGALVRRFSSQDKPDPVDAKGLNVPTYWIRPETVLPSSAGMHRWVWNLRYPRPKTMETEYPISAVPHDTPLGPLGPPVVPGEYTVRLTVDGTGQSQKFKVRMDPRVPATSADLAAMLAAEKRATADLAANYDALQQVRSLRAKLKAVCTTGAEVVRSSAADLEAKFAKLEGGTAAKPPEPGINANRGLETMHSWLAQVYGTLDSADAAPTTQALAMLAELEKASREQLLAVKQLREGALNELNDRLRKTGAAEVSRNYDELPAQVLGAEKAEE